MLNDDTSATPGAALMPELPELDWRPFQRAAWAIGDYLRETLVPVLSEIVAAWAPVMEAMKRHEAAKAHAEWRLRRQAEGPVRAAAKRRARLSTQVRRHHPTR